MTKRVCRISKREFTAPPELEGFLEKVSKLNPALGQSLPLPAVSPAEQLRLLSVYGNVCQLSRATSAISGKELLTRFRPEDGFRVVSTEEFWGDDIDNTQFGREYDFSLAFPEQWRSLLHTAYLLPLNSGSVENSEYVNSARSVKNSYLSFVIFNSEDCLYCYDVQHATGCVACFSARESQYCYECSDIQRSYECFFSTALAGCNECIGCFDCRGCTRCIGCFGLEHAECQVFNKPVSLAEYESLRSEILSGSNKVLQTFLNKFSECRSHVVQTNLNCENCSGAHLRNCRDLVECYGCTNCEHCGYLIGGVNSRDCWVGWGIDSELCYQTVGSAVHNCHYCYHTYNSDSCFYSFMMNAGCHDCFGCIGLVKKAYCILNRQYSRTEYFELLPRVVRHLASSGVWGEFLPQRAAPHPYDDSWADLHIEPEPLDVIRERGYRFLPAIPEPKAAAGSREIVTLPDSLDQVGWEALSGKAVKCEESGKLFNVQKKEFEFHQRYRLPLPRIHWERRLLHLAERKKRFPII